MMDDIKKRLEEAGVSIGVSTYLECYIMGINEVLIRIPFHLLPKDFTEGTNFMNLYNYCVDLFFSSRDISNKEELQECLDSSILLCLEMILKMYKKSLSNEFASYDSLRNELVVEGRLIKKEGNL